MGAGSASANVPTANVPTANVPKSEIAGGCIAIWQETKNLARHGKTVTIASLSFLSNFSCIALPQNKIAVDVRF